MFILLLKNIYNKKYQVDLKKFFRLTLQLHHSFIFFIDKKLCKFINNGEKKLNHVDIFFSFF